MAEKTVRLINKYTVVPGRIPTGTTSHETNFVRRGEVSQNLADKRLFGFDGTSVFEFGINSFLALTGGTLSGNLSGTSAYFDNYLSAGTSLENIIYAIATSFSGSSHDYYTTGVTLHNTIAYFDRNDQLSAYTLQLSGLTSGITATGDCLPLSGGVMDSGAKVYGGGETTGIELDFGLSGNPYFIITSDAGNYGETALYIDPTYAELSAYGSGGQVDIYAESSFITVTNQRIRASLGQDELFLYDNTSSTYSGFNLGGTKAVMIATNRPTFASGITNSVIIGGDQLSATASNTVYMPNVNISGTITSGNTSLSTVIYNIATGVTPTNLNYLPLSGGVMQPGAKIYGAGVTTATTIDFGTSGSSYFLVSTDGGSASTSRINLSDALGFQAYTPSNGSNNAFIGCGSNSLNISDLQNQLFHTLKIDLIAPTTYISGLLSAGDISATTRVVAGSNIIAATNIDWSTSNSFYKTITSNTTFTFSSTTNGQTIVVSVKQDSTGGYSVSWPGTVSWPNGVAPVQTPTSGKTDIYTFIQINSSIYGSVVQNF